MGVFARALTTKPQHAWPVMLVLAAVYAAVARLGLLLDPVGGFATLVWPPTGIALAALLFFGYRLWPGVALGALVANVWSGAPVPVALGMALGNTLEAVLGTYALRSVPGFGLSLSRVRDVLALVLGAALGSTLVSASLGTLSLRLGGVIGPERFLETWRAWWLGDAVGNLIVAPVLCVWAASDRATRFPKRRSEALLLGGALLALGVLVFGWARPVNRGAVGHVYIFFPVLIWAALRFGQRGATLTTLAVSGIAITGTAYGHGPFALPSLNASLLALQTFMAVAAGTFLLLGANSAERESARAELELARIELENKVALRTQDVRRAFTELQKREGQLAEAQELTHIGSWDWDIASNHVTWTDELYRIYGVTPADFAASYEGQLARVHLDDRAELHAVIQAALSDAVPFEHEYRIVRADGAVRVLLTRARVALDEAKRPARLTGTAQDITERHEADQALRKARDELEARVEARTLELSRVNATLRSSEARKAAILEAALDCIVTMDHDGRIVDFNPAAERTFGHTAAEIAGQDLAERLIPEKLRSAHRLGLARYLETGHGAVFGKRVEFQALRADATEFPVELALTAVQTAERRPLFVAYLRDMTERKQAEQARVLLEQRMQEGQKLESLGVLAGGIAHDFNNILMTVLGNASLTRIALHDNPIALSHVAQIEEASRRATDLCRQMLAYAGRGRFVLQRTSLNQLIEDTTHLLQISISKKAVLRFHLDANLPAIIADATQIRQVVMNLVINASDAIGERSGVISISTGVVRADRTYLEKTFLAPEIPEGDYVYLEVSDTGVGMSAETQARIFEPFFSSKFAGRGLGLSAVLGIVRGHKGALKVYSELNKGSSFKFLLPIAPEDAASALQLKRRTQSPWAAQGTILVVDDEETVRAVASRMLEALGFRVLTAGDGREAQVRYREHQREIVGVLMDLTMPHLDGEETFRELRRIEPKVRVLLMSGYNEQDAIARFVGKGLAGFIQKPFNIDELQERLRAVLA